MKKRIFPLILSAALLFSSCSGGGQPSDSTAEPSALDYWKNIDRGKVVAHVEGNDKADMLDVTYGEFFREYMYFLLSNGVDDDMSGEKAEECASYREYLITYLTFEKICLLKAEEMGIGVSTLTDAEKAQIKETADENREYIMYQLFYDAEDDETPEEEIEKQLSGKMSEMMSEAELPDDIFYIWEQNKLIQDKLLEKLTENISISESSIDELFESYVYLAKEAYSSDVNQYEANSAYTSVYVPEGTRLADQILLMFDDDTMNSIREARAAGNNEEADRIRAEAYEAQLKEKAQGLINLLSAGSDFDELQAVYNEDSADDPYPVVIGSQMYVKEFSDAIFSVDSIGGIAEPAVSDYGVHIIKYVGDKTLSGAETADVRAQMREYLEYQESMNIKNNAYTDWMEEYPYTTDYALLKIKPEGAGGAE